MRQFAMISPSVWASARFKKCTSDQRLLLFYLMTCSHQTSIGCAHIPAGYTCADLGWEDKRYVEALAGLVIHGIVQQDTETDEILIERWFKHCPPKNPKHRIGNERLIENIQSSVLQAACREAMENACRSVAKQKCAADEISEEQSNLLSLKRYR